MIATVLMLATTAQAGHRRRREGQELGDPAGGDNHHEVTAHETFIIRFCCRFIG